MKEIRDGKAPKETSDTAATPSGLASDGDDTRLETSPGEVLPAVPPSASNDNKTSNFTYRTRYGRQVKPVTKFQA